MVSRMRVAELRSALEQRNLDSSGLKADLVARLQEAMDNEEDGEIEDDEPPSKRPKLDPSSMTVVQLRSALKDRGISTAGIKAELIDRLSEAMEDDGNTSGGRNTKDDVAAPAGRKKSRDDDDDASADDKAKQRDRRTAPARKKSGDKDDAAVGDQAKKPAAGKEKEVEPPKMVTLTKKGRAVVDPVAGSQFQNYHVLEMGNDVYDAMLNQTSIANNNNKFYVVQALESDGKNSYSTITRWGRVGENGQMKVFSCSGAHEAISMFESKFYEKTRNRWSDRANFVPKSGKYTLIEMDYGGDDDAQDDAQAKKKEKKNKAKVEDDDMPKTANVPRESKLDRRVEQFISLICNVKMMRQQMVEIGYNPEKMPLGKLSKTTILQGYEVLKRIAAAIESRASRAELDQLSSEFFTVIPHDFGRRSIRDQTITTVKHLKDKISMVEALAEIEVATKLLNEPMEDEEDPAFVHYKQLKCSMEPLDNGSEEYQWISKYLQNTHADTHRQFNLKIANIFKVEKDGEGARFSKFSKTPNRMLLWHGSRLTNWTGILSQGLRIAPPEAPATGYMFGKGVYFADMVSKSANYCYTSSSESTGVLLLCEVALGDMNQLVHADYNADRLPPGKLSTKGVGSTAPDLKESIELPDGVVVPLGKPKKQQADQGYGSLLYNEYIVYNTAQIRMRYLVQVKFDYNRGYF